MTLPYRIAVTGHRRLGTATTVRFVGRAFYAILAQSRRAHPEGIEVLFGMAEGADTLFAKIALGLGIPLKAFIAYDGFVDDFPSGSTRQLYQHLLAQCQDVFILPFQQPSDDAFMAVGRQIVNGSDLVVAAWNGQPAAGKGGTGDVVYYAQCIGRPVIHVCTADRTLWYIQSEYGITHKKPLTQVNNSL